MSDTMLDALAVGLSQWVDEAPGNADRDPEALLWHRVAKVAEESGEAIAAVIGATGGNPRKGKTHELADIERELLDTALAALCAVAHLHENDVTSDPVRRLTAHATRVGIRAGIVT